MALPLAGAFVLGHLSSYLYNYFVGEQIPVPDTGLVLIEPEVMTAPSPFQAIAPQQHMAVLQAAMAKRRAVIEG